MGNEFEDELVRRFWDLWWKEEFPDTNAGAEMTGLAFLIDSPAAKAPEPDFDEKRTAPGSYPEEFDNDPDPADNDPT